MAGYTRVDTGNNIADGNVISAADLDNEFDGIQAAFNANTGHNHDGTTGEGAPILVLGPTQDVVVGASTVTPKTTNTVDIGSSSLKFKDLYMAGNASIGGTLAVTGVATLTAQPILSSLTASRAVFTDGSKGLVSNAITGTGNVVMSASPTLTGTITAEALTLSGAVTASGGTANGVAYLNGSKVLTSGSALTFDGGMLALSGSGNIARFGDGTNTFDLRFRGANNWSIQYAPSTDEWALQRNSVNQYSANGSSHIWSFPAGEQMRLTSTGLGIGTSSPTGRLNVSAADTGNVVGSGAATLNITNSNEAAFGRTTNLTFSSGTGVAANTIAAISGIYTSFSSSRAGALAFSTDNGSGSFTEKMRLDSSGNLGIGTSSLIGGAKLDVRGANSNNLADLDAQVLTLFDTTSYASGVGAGIALGYKFNSSGSYIQRGAVIKVVKENGTDGNYASAMVFGTTGNAVATTEKMRLDSSGNLGLGVTPSAWTTVTPVFQINRAALYGYGNEVNLSANYLFSSGDKYIASDFATRYNQANGQHRWYTAPSGTAGNAISFTQAMTLDASGRLMVGNTNAQGAGITATNSFYGLSADGTTVGSFSTNSGWATLSAYKGNGAYLTLGTADTGGTVQERARIDSSGNITSTTSEAYLYFTSTYSVGANTRASIRTVGAGGGSGYGGDLRFSTRAPNNAWNTDAVTIDSSGNLMVGTTSTSGSNSGSFFYLPGTGAYAGVASFQHSTTNVSGSGFINFNYNGSAIGAIQQNGTTAVSYATTSDYRLKENIQPMTGALAKVAALKPVTYTWKADGSAGEGFIAHELAEVCPAAVTGEKDAVDAYGKPQYQGIDVSFLVGTLTAAIQELKAEFDAYKASHP